MSLAVNKLKEMSINDFNIRMNCDSTIIKYISKLEYENKLLKEKCTCHLADCDSNAKGNDCDVSELINKGIKRMKKDKKTINNESKAQYIDLIIGLYETISKLETENKELREGLEMVDNQLEKGLSGSIFNNSVIHNKIKELLKGNREWK